MKFAGIGSAEGSNSRVLEITIFSLHHDRSRNEEEGAKELTLIECLLYTSHCADSFTYIVFWARYCSHVTDDRLWEV